MVNQARAGQALSTLLIERGDPEEPGSSQAPSAAVIGWA
jgi:hypothetical protein